VADARARVADLFGLRVAQLVLINPGGMPKTSSGKLRRRHCRDLFLAGKLDRAEIFEPLPARESDGQVA
jgi:acyl-CoA synthetase (AMP-forming)/AMP-acid ligase II